jgi:pyruvate-formate lyase-activating enzyme
VCRGCFCQFEQSYFTLYDDPVSRLTTKSPESPPTHFLTKEEVLRRLKGLSVKRILLMGVEPSLDPELPSLARALHEEIGSSNILMTNGLKLVDLEHIDLVLFSLKAYSEEIHRDYTGVSNKKILNNFIEVYHSGKKLQAITLLISDYIDAGEIERIARFIASVDKDIPLMIHAYFPVPGSPWRAATTEEVAEAARLAGKHLTNVPYRTLDLKRVGEPAVRIV